MVLNVITILFMVAGWFVYDGSGGAVVALSGPSFRRKDCCRVVAVLFSSGCADLVVLILVDFSFNSILLEFCLRRTAGEPAGEPSAV